MKIIILVSQIFGGDETNEGQFPFAALVGVTRTRQADYKKEKYTAWVCGGTLIDLWYVVTAGHCHQDSLLQGGSITRVRLGEWSVGEDNSLVQDFDILSSDVRVHEEYRRCITALHNDIALVRLPAAAQLSSRHRAAQETNRCHQKSHWE